MQLNENLPEIKDLLWQLLRGKHIDIEDNRYQKVVDRFDEFKLILHSLGFDLIHDSMGFFYLQSRTRQKNYTSAKICTYFLLLSKNCKNVKRILIH